MFNELQRANIDAKIQARRAYRLEDHVLDDGLLEFQLVLLGGIITINFFEFLFQVNLSWLLGLIDTLPINAPPTADLALIMRIYTDLWYLVHLERRIALQKSENLLIFLTLFLFKIMVSDFDDLKS